MYTVAKDDNKNFADWQAQYGEDPPLPESVCATLDKRRTTLLYCCRRKNGAPITKQLIAQK